MNDDDQMPFTIEPEQAWTLSDDRETVRFNLPALPIEGLCYFKPLERFS